MPQSQYHAKEERTLLIPAGVDIPRRRMGFTLTAVVPYFAAVAGDSGSASYGGVLIGASARYAPDVAGDGRLELAVPATVPPLGEWIGNGFGEARGDGWKVRVVKLDDADVVNAGGLVVGGATRGTVRKQR